LALSNNNATRPRIFNPKQPHPAMKHSLGTSISKA
jgi:hypothetical protein